LLKGIGLSHQSHKVGNPLFISLLSIIIAIYHFKQSLAVCYRTKRFFIYQTDPLPKTFLIFAYLLAMSLSPANSSIAIPYPDDYMFGVNQSQLLVSA
jgi:hypothetical protein